MRGTEVKKSVFRRRREESNYFSTLKMKAAYSSETLITVYQTALCHVTEDIIIKKRVVIVQDRTGSAVIISPKILPPIFKLLMFSCDCVVLVDPFGSG
jgi:hypothetical protein